MSEDVKLSMERFVNRQVAIKAYEYAEQCDREAVMAESDGNHKVALYKKREANAARHAAQKLLFYDENETVDE